MTDSIHSPEGSPVYEDSISSWIHETVNTGLFNSYPSPSEIDVPERTEHSYASSQRSDSPTVGYPYSDSHRRDSTDDSLPSLSPDLHSTATISPIPSPSRLDTKGSPGGQYSPGVTQPISPISPLRRVFTSRRSIFSDDASVQGGRPPSYRASEGERSPSPFRGEDVGDIQSTSPPHTWGVLDGAPLNRAASGAQTSRSLAAFASPREPRYLYYRMYTDDGPIPSKRPVYLDDQYLGRIVATSVVPPHTVASLKRCISGTEQIDTTSAKSELFVDLTSGTPLRDGPISILEGDCPGSMAEKPMALVYSTSGQDEAAGTTATSVMTAPAVSLSVVPDVRATFRRRIRAKRNSANSSKNAHFLDFNKNEILYTDGRSELKAMSGRSGGRGAAPKFKVYKAVNSMGVEGYVVKDSVEFC